MFNFFKGKWSAFISGLSAALLFIIGLYLLNTPLGMTDAYLKISDYCRESIHMRKVSEFFPFDWQTAFLIGIAIGAFIASLSSGNFQLRMIPEDVKGSGPVGAFGITILQNIVGGFLVMTGLQFAGDSFLGQWSAAMQLSAGAWVFLFSFIVWGVVFSGFTRAAMNSSAASGKKKGAK